MSILDWKPATVKDVRVAAKDIMTLVLRAPHITSYRAGQYCELRIPGQPSVSRIYSIASTPDNSGNVEFGVQVLPGGELSPRLASVKPSDTVEVRGPHGGVFIWTPEVPGPLILIAGGSGVVPLVSMLRTYNQKPDGRDVRILMSAKTLAHVPYRDELEKAGTVFTLTREKPQDWTGETRRVDKQMLADFCADLLNKKPAIYVCGKSGFVETVMNLLTELGFDPRKILAERFD